MPIGGLKWRDELEHKEFKKVKSEVQVLGIDDAPFERDDEDVKIVAVLTRGAKMMDGVFHSSIKKDGLDATDKIVELVKGIKRENARAILLDGVTYGGFNTVDIDKIYKETHIPVIACMDHRFDHARFHKAMRNLDNRGLREAMVKAAGKVYEAELDGDRKIYFQTSGINEKDAASIVKLTTVNGLVPEPLRAAHMVAKGAYTEIPKPKEEEELPHIKAYNYVKHQHKKVRRMKKRYLPGMAGEVFSFLFAVLVAWLIIQVLGWMLATSSPLVVVESESMIHDGNWEQWHFVQNLNPNIYGFGGGMNVGDIVLVKGDDPDDIEVGDVIIYTKYDSRVIGGEPIIHRVIGIVEVDGNSVNTLGAVEFEDNNIVTPCSPKSTYSINEIRNIYSTKGIRSMYPDLNLDEYRLFITKGDNNELEDQCTDTSVISFPIHDDLIVGTAKVDVPYLGYVKLGLVCTFRFATGNVCGCRCWWTADHPKCCK